ncbi:ABC transporter permease subunit [Nocardioides sp. AE5]|uniref:ABC transporter permease n=1 Tax=Nocardioides sp. AE5 TaxID=2962573 RepID=UPI002881FEDA|nr:ABC transporter permease subunit [Nocardioides sp. AE5]MDT0201851.1 ABC transporter permease subunit [Nocardioides sp. AE5]
MKLSGSGMFWRDVLDTLGIWFVALSIGTLLGVIVGLAMGASQWVSAGLGGLVEFLRPIPTVALIPVVVVLYGTGFTSAYILSALGAVWPVLIHSVYGAHAVDPVTRDMAKVFGLSRSRQFAVITLPSAAPFIAMGIRLSMAIALILTITAGIVIGSPGLGNSITHSANAGAFPEMYGLIISTGVIGVLLNLASLWLFDRWLPWSDEFGGATK